MAAPLKQLMKAIAVRSAQIAYPTGRKDFAVKQVRCVLKMSFLLMMEIWMVQTDLMTNCIFFGRAFLAHFQPKKRIHS
jgi:hypothetical protein